MSSYAQHLEAAKVAALAALFELLVTTEDPIEKRRIATTLLRIPDPKPTRATDRCSERPVQPTSNSRTTETSPPPEPTPQDTKPSTQDASSPSPHPPSDIPHPTSLPSLPEVNAFLHILAAQHAHRAHRASPAPTKLTTDELAPSG